MTSISTPTTYLIFTITPTASYLVDLISTQIEDFTLPPTAFPESEYFLCRIPYYTLLFKPIFALNFLLLFLFSLFYYEQHETPFVFVFFIISKR